MRTFLLAIGAIMGLFHNAAAFDLDASGAEALRAAGLPTVGEMVIGDSGYVAFSWGVWCSADGVLTIPNDIQIVGKETLQTKALLRVLPGRAASVALPDDFSIDPDNNNIWQFAVPTCEDLVAAGLTKNSTGLAVQEIDGFTTYSAFIQSLKKRVKKAEQ